MRILIGLTYYRPHYSGLTIYTERLARALVRLGHQVTVLTSRFNRDLPEQEIQDGVRIIRPAVLFHLSKGVIMPSMPLWALRLLRDVDVVNLHLPQMDSMYIAWMSRMFGKPVVATYHCDLKLPHGLVHWIANQGAHLANHLTVQASRVVVQNTRDYAEHSGFLRPYLGRLQVVPTPVELTPASAEQTAAFRQKFNIRPDQIYIGMVGRLASEKGVEYLIQAMPAVIERFPNARVLYAGQYQNVMGEEQYAQKLAPMIEALGEHWTFLGLLSPVELTAFYQSIAVNVSPSLNSTESFGMVQVEAMSCGTPAVASDLPGVRCAVQESGMGLVVAPRDSGALAAALIEILEAPDQYRGSSQALQHKYASDTVARQYEAIFKELTGHQ
jgi:glycosyltransferase involved in cell wall biosynthesis